MKHKIIKVGDYTPYPQTHGFISFNYPKDMQLGTLWFFGIDMNLNYYMLQSSSHAYSAYATPLALSIGYDIFAIYESI